MRHLTTNLTILLSTLLFGQGSLCDQLQAGFTVFPSGSTVQFSNATTGSASGTLFFWSFGDGATSQDPQPWHTYDEPGAYQVCLTVVTILTDTGGAPLTCEDTFCAALTVQGTEPCSPNFVVAMDWVDQGNGLVSFVATSTFPNTNFIWYFGDGTEAYGSTANHAYMQDGTYSVCVAGWYYNESAQDSCWSEDCGVITVGGGDPCDQLTACYQVSQLSANSFLFNNCSSQQSDTEFVWDLGDGSTSSTVAPTHTYTASGVYDVCLTVYWENCVDSTCTTITVVASSPCEALNAEFTPYVGGLGVNLQNAVVNNTWTYLWNFGDGTTGTGPSAGHQYSAPGTYSICLTVYTWDPVAQDTCYADHCEEVIVGSEGCDPNFAVELAWNAGTDNVVYFNATSNHPNTSFIWYFGDGTEAFGSTTDHAYMEDGTYSVCVAGWYYNESAQDSCWSEDCGVIIVGGSDPCDQLTACYQTSQLSSNSFFFNNCSSQQNNAQFLWDFGDGSTSSAVAPIHAYTASGVYNVCLTVYWENCVDSTCTTVTVAGGGDLCDELVACFEPLPFENGVYAFSNCSQVLSIDIPWYAFWDFGDGTTSSEVQPTHAFTPGIHTVCLTISHGDCVDTTCINIIVNGGGPGCDPNYAASYNYQVLDNAVIFFANFDTPTQGVLWTFPDGVQVTEPIHTHLFEPPGPFEVCLSSWYWNEQTQDSCWAHTCQLIDPFDVNTSVTEGAADNLSVYPVPAYDHLTIEGLDPGASLRVFSADGRLVIAARSMNTIHHIDVRALAKGTYLLAVEHGATTSHRLIVVD